MLTVRTSKETFIIAKDLDEILMRSEMQAGEKMGVGK